MEEKKPVPLRKGGNGLSLPIPLCVYASEKNSFRLFSIRPHVINRGFCLISTRRARPSMVYSPMIPIPEKLPFASSPLNATPFLAAAFLALPITSSAEDVNEN